MTSGPIPLDQDPDEILEALRRAVRDDPAELGRPAEEVARELARGGYLEGEPDPVLVAEMLGVVEAEGGRAPKSDEEEFDPDVEPGEA